MGNDVISGWPEKTVILIQPTNINEENDFIE